MEEVGFGPTRMAKVGFGLTGMAKAGFSLTVMAQNGGSRFWSDWNSLEWKKSVLA
jgi:hypothetical protein